MRERININKDWLFALDGNAYRVDLPHTWNALDGQDGRDGYVRSCGSYSKHLEPVSDGRVFIDIEGANAAAGLYVNGNPLAMHKGGYSAFRAELTPFIRKGCDIEIRVTNRDIDDVYPSNADFTFYGGLYRNVSLVKTGRCRFSYREHSSDGVYVTPVKRNGFWEVAIRAIIDSPDDSLDVVYTLLDADGKKVASASVKPSAPDARLKVCEPVLWQGRENPYLYTLLCRIGDGEDFSDSLDIDVGFREIRIDPSKGFFLNGKHIKLKGVSRHQDRENMGNAITEAEHAEDVALICELGANSVRLAHYQQNRYFYSLCDKAGLLVWAEMPVISRFSQKKQANARQQLCELIRQNYNHPCIYCWGIENEITIGGRSSKNLHKSILELNEIAHMLDYTRFTTAAQVMMCAPEDKLNEITDILGYNHYFGWYAGHAQEINSWLDDFHTKQPGICLCLSEYGAEGITKYHSGAPVQGDYSEDYQAIFHEAYIKAINSREWLFGSYVWNMFDFGSAARNEGGVRGRNNKGLVTFDRKIRKDSFYLYKAYWSEEKFVHITGERYVERPFGKSVIKVYSNCENVTLSINGEERELTADKVFVFDDVVLKEGENVITASSGGCSHEIKVIGVNEEKPEYSMPEGASSFVRNWFEPEGAPRADRLSLDDTVGDVLKSEDAMTLLGTVAGDVIKSPALKLASPIKIRTLLKLAKPVIGNDISSMAQGYLQTIKK